MRTFIILMTGLLVAAAMPGSIALAADCSVPDAIYAGGTTASLDSASCMLDRTAARDIAARHLARHGAAGRIRALTPGLSP